MSVQIESITSNMIPEALRLRKDPPKVKIEPSAPLPYHEGELKPMIVKRYFKEKQPENKRERVELERHIPLVIVPREFATKADYLKSLGKGSVVCLRGWSLGPYQSVGVVWRVSPTMIVLTNGKRFERHGGLSIDGEKQMITPLSDKAKGVLVKKQRVRLNYSEAM